MTALVLDADDVDGTGRVDRPGRDIRWGMAIAGVFFVGFLGFASIAPLDAGAYAEGVVAVSGNRQAVQHRDGGIVTRILVVEGAHVRHGQPVAEIAAGELRANERALAGEWLHLLAQRERLSAERDGRSSFARPVEFHGLGEQDRELAELAMRGQQLQFASRRAATGAEKQVLGQRGQQHGEQIAGYRDQLVALANQQRLLGDELTGLRALEARGFASTNRVRALERTAAAIDGEIGTYRARIAEASAAIGETSLQAVSVDRTRMETVADQLRDTNVRLDEVRPKLIAARDQLARAIVRAPASGKVVGLAIHTAGGVVAPGATLMEIVPQDRGLVIDAKVQPTDADDLAIGQRSQVSFTALHERSLPILYGRISKISADSFADERSGASFFKAEIVIPSTELDKIRKVRGVDALQAGLPVEVMVPTRARTMLTYLVEPITQTLWRAGREQ